MEPLAVEPQSIAVAEAFSTADAVTGGDGDAILATLTRDIAAARPSRRSIPAPTRRRPSSRGNGAGQRGT